MFEKLKMFFLTIFAKPLIIEGGDLLEIELRKLATDKPKLFKALVVSVYVFATEYGNDLVASTKTDLDDKVLEELLDALSKVADEFKIDLTFEATKMMKEEKDV